MRTYTKQIQYLKSVISYLRKGVTITRIITSAATRRERRDDSSSDTLRKGERREKEGRKKEG